MGKNGRVKDRHVRLQTVRAAGFQGTVKRHRGEDQNKETGPSVLQIMTKANYTKSLTSR